MADQPANISMTSEVSICNQALSWVGAKPITSLNDQKTTAEWCRNNYPHLRDAVIQSRNWTFATIRAKSVTANRDEWDLKYSHPFPKDWLTVLRVYWKLSNPPVTDSEWTVESGKILSQYDTIYLWGLRRVTDTGDMSALFVQALAARLASDMAIPIAENIKLQQTMWNLYDAKLAEATTRDGQQGSNESIQSDIFVNARTRGRLPQ